ALQKDSASADFAFVEKFPSGYKVEGKITWAEFAAAGGDSVFVPKTGMKLPIDFSYNDADLDVREGILTYSPNNEDQSWSSPARWTYTWIGDQMTVGVEKDPYALPTQFKLEQNYPNPFNPSTTINYSITEQTQVTVKIYNVLGQQVRELVNEVQTPGVYNVRFDASDLTSGLYVYQISAGKFTDTKKMMLLK
ncbi:MAG: T9SS type A sorting domain-containing protein, partial [Melioribacteraceae bacterium]|nr:T9SS type A sorting domain-containing protein [Melioribacteraceae bacterium]